MYFLDILFVVFHSALVLFHLVGWVWRRTRGAHLLVTGITMCSWFGLGIWYGFGYCPCTDWHWEVKRHLGESQLPLSYVKYYLDKATGSDWEPLLVDASVAVLGLAAFGLSICLNWRDSRGRRR